MRALRWAAALCWLAWIASCAVSVPEFSVASSAGGSGGGPGTGGGAPVDCTATSDCSSAPGCACVPSVSNFQGPVLFAVAGESVSCPAGFATPTPMLAGAFTTLTAAPPAKCNRCECDTGPCGQVVIKAYTNQTCTGSPLAMVPQEHDVCQGSFGFNIGSVMVSEAQASATKCVPSGGEVMKLPTTTHNVATFCSGELGTGCGAGDFCVPAPPHFDVCVYAKGHVDCPTSGYSTRHTVYTGTNDNRHCSGCTCGTAAPTCPTTFEAFNKDLCMTGSLGDGVAGTCFSAPMSDGKSIEAHVKTPCPPMGGNPTGEVELTDPYTVCCR